MTRYWKEIKGYENKYKISNYGTVISKKRLSSCCYGKQRKIKEKIIYPSPDKCGYLRIMLCKLTDTLIRELIRNGNVTFDGGKYYVCKD